MKLIALIGSFALHDSFAHFRPSMPLSYSTQAHSNLARDYLRTFPHLLINRSAKWPNFPGIVALSQKRG